MDYFPLMIMLRVMVSKLMVTMFKKRIIKAYEQVFFNGNRGIVYVAKGFMVTYASSRL
jgi:hypothetical protein